ncbi:protein-glutamate methylesterase/protein-glutamine glutaminase [Methylomagnum ishizawai]|uniref:protein-glutamate methylesterase/protein-glutamine glutaminase n=1 Tax=Methylomagnum ishizawai TaxID=1760988 RepID=UPI001C33B521|nr:chemotaxis response regulator protein-glutamate methylesterase [Methylomagnum ishizawai]BBL74886.1 chemotaxis response regulator protein-glutamate methylesterase [Methylomagnum ishizawai]
MKPINVLIVDDSAVVRQIVSALVARDPSIQVMAAVSDPILAMERMKRQWPDVILLDIEMPRMDGITFLKKIMEERPTPVVICSTLTERGAETTLQALSAGAVGILTKPKLGLKKFLEESSIEFIDAVKSAAQANLRRLGPTPRPSVAANPAAVPHVPPPAPKPTPDSRALARTTDRIVAIGTSTGGTQALEVLLTALPRVSPGLVIVQHMPERFTAMFAQRLDGLCAIEVREAKDGDRVLPGLALIAPGGKHMRVKLSGAQYMVEVLDGPLVNRHRPSVDVLFRSVAKYAGKNALGIIMTGMGDDGARGLKEMHEAGADTIAQDEDSCVVFGMPKEAIKLGAAGRVLTLRALAPAIQAYGG